MLTSVKDIIATAKKYDETHGFYSDILALGELAFHEMPKEEAVVKVAVFVLDDIEMWHRTGRRYMLPRTFLGAYEHIKTLKLYQETFAFEGRGEPKENWDAGQTMVANIIRAYHENLLKL